MRTERTESALLPAGLMDVLPPAAAFEAETVGRLMRSFAAFGYDRVKPPLLEFEDTLLAGAGAALAHETFRLMDPLSQRMLALRPDMTMQVARIAASRLAHRPRPLRLSYAGQVLRLRGAPMRPERQLGQVGAEIVGTAATLADAEVVLMATSALADLGVEGFSVDLGLPSLVPAILAAVPADPRTRADAATALARKDEAAVRELAPVLGAETADLVAGLVHHAGPVERALRFVAEARLPAAADRHRAALIAVVEHLRAASGSLTLTIDPVESRGFEYHTGVTFSLFAPGVAGELGRGGRYRTDAGEDATGVTLFMDAVLQALPATPPARRLYLPHGTPAAAAARLRAQGWIAVAGLDPAADPRVEAPRLGCSHVLSGETITAATETAGEGS
jgi:ATP phosphoribosyltransferase regulatory subunit